MAGQAKRETVVDLAKFIDKGVHVKLSGGREGAARCARLPSRAPAHEPPVTGSLKGYDQLLNLVLDEAQETLRGAHTRARLSAPS